jgi:hypothetical protein
VKKLAHKFVEFIPDVLEEGVLYASLTYGTASHRCCCGCGREVVTPLTPTDWKLIFDGETVSLYPSIGNWNFPCRSHYWIWNSYVEWAGDWSDRRISAALEDDRIQKANHYGGATAIDSAKASGDIESCEEHFWSRLRKRWSRDQ